VILEKGGLYGPQVIARKIVLQSNMAKSLLLTISIPSPAQLYMKLVAALGR